MFGAALVALVTIAATVEAHHSFAMYNLRIMTVMTGVVTRVDPAPEPSTDLLCRNERRAPRTSSAARTANRSSGPSRWEVPRRWPGRASPSTRSRPALSSALACTPCVTVSPPGSREGGLFKCPDRTPPRTRDALRLGLRAYGHRQRAATNTDGTIAASGTIPPGPAGFCHGLGVRDERVDNGYPKGLARLSHGFSSRGVGDAVRARRAPGGRRRRT